MRRQHWQEDEDVFQPLMGPQRLDVVFDRSGIGDEMLGAFTDAFSFPPQCGRGIDGDRLGGPLPNRQIGLGIAHIGKALESEPFL